MIAQLWYRALGDDVDTITLDDLLTVIEFFMVAEGEEAVYDAIGSEVDTDLIEEHAVVGFDEDMTQMVVPKVDMLPLIYGQSGGQEGGTQGKIIPKTFARCEEPSCKFSMELDDNVSALSVLENHVFVAHKRQEQHHQQGLCGRKGGQKRAPITKQYLRKTHGVVGED